MTETVDPILTQVENEFKTILWDNWVSAALSRLFILVPWMAVWPLGPLVRAIVVPFVDSLFRQGVLLFDLSLIAFKDAAHQSEYDKRMVALKILAKEKGVDSDAYKQARVDAAKAMSSFTQFNR